jgi:hypothetical protein
VLCTGLRLPRLQNPLGRHGRRAREGMTILANERLWEGQHELGNDADCA